ncbi:xylose isomerase [Chryseolinea sp. H1M3-3]|uniref:sugar phosphate isomerase/epimerase family protein n=1 Tax=Chryseolinea sp. H1M3-3 TaxID=3034144 RepID=UPI0023EB6720|nr:xylose isomerase [Chryseolinea sp. H1M3-3]
MKIFFKSFIRIVIVLILASCATQKTGLQNENLFAKENLVAWCVVPFDSVQRTPKERADMLKELGFKQFAYDWRPQHLDTFADEIKELKKHEIKLKSVWMWIDSDTGKILDDDNEQLLNIIKQNNVRTDLWLGFSNKHFEGLSDEQKLEKAVASVNYIHNRAKELGCTVSLYNHGDWFGEPINQVRIIEKMGGNGVGIVYNFHHAHLQVKEFPELLTRMLPYLNTVNLNGMKVAGPKILTIGEGNEELDMLKILKASGYNGSVGIICHIETEDAKVVLERNLNGLKGLLETMGEKEAVATY